MIYHSLRRTVVHQLPHLILALRGGAAALAALAAAEFLNLECPYWAAMTALIVIQPTRGLLFEKSFYRLVGTVIGSLAALLLLLTTRSPLLLTIALSLWIAGCVGIGNLMYGLRSYSVMVAGCTCVVIAMSGYQNQSHLHDIAFSRIACIIVGIIVSTAVTALFTPLQSRAELVDRLNRVSGEAVAWLALLLRQGRGEDLVRLEQDVLIEIAEIENDLDVVGAGSLSFKKRKRHIKSLIASLLSLLAVGRLAGEQLARHQSDSRHGYWRDLLARHLEKVADRMDSSSGNCPAEMTAIVAEAKAHLPLLGETLAEIATSFQAVLADCETMTDPREEPPQNRLLRHRDWREARRGAIRAALAIAAAGVTWSVTGWAQGPLMLMAISIMVTIFSTKEHPAFFLGQILIGAATGSALAVFCRAVLLPGVTDPFVVAAIIAPFLFIGIFAMTQRRTAIGATDATLFFIFVTQPGVAVTLAPAGLVRGAVAMVMGVAFAWIAYRYLIPVNPAIRLHSLLNAIMADLEVLASLDSPEALGKLRARLQHRVIRLVAMARRYNSEDRALVEEGLAALAVGRCIERLLEVQKISKVAPAAVVIIRDTLRSLSDATRRPQDVSALLGPASVVLYAVLDPAGEGRFIHDRVAAEAVRDAAALFGRNEVFWGDRSINCLT